MNMAQILFSLITVLCCVIICDVTKAAGSHCVQCPTFFGKFGLDWLSVFLGLCTKCPRNENPCNPNPCKNGATCSPTSRTDYSCNCPSPTTDKNCSKLNCGNSVHCFIVSNTVYYLENTTVSMKRVADKWCNDEGRYMLMIKDAASKQLIADEIRAHFNAKGENLREFYAWVGLQRKSAESPWIWDDGSPLGSYQPWASFSRNISDCVIAYGDMQFDMINANCNLHPLQYYVICQKTILA